MFWKHLCFKKMERILLRPATLDYNYQFTTLFPCLNDYFDASVATPWFILNISTHNIIIAKVCRKILINKTEEAENHSCYSSYSLPAFICLHCILSPSLNTSLLYQSFFWRFIAKAKSMFYLFFSLLILRVYTDTGQPVL